jgi:hypothetical protein
VAVVISQDSELGKELARWNAPKREGGMNANGFEPYPAMLFRAARHSTGKVMCGHPGAATGDAEAMAFTNQCQFIVQDAEEHAKMRRAGWHESPQGALDAFEQDERVTADAAAEEQFRVKRMSDTAQREFDAAQDASDFHDPDPAAPKKPAPATTVLTESQVKARKKR